ncbi:exodeoxyribonuclease V [Galdieria sulphuraria]|uniref:Exodeoxyribonuclease V n=1 Tax=Galdieria sulphuraria TaxID=130081 RepID=M2XTI1_GALSU|nr:exodeoxyribonuclease V [Galdieria sulphuraria]EME26958.1 exodeoxyribonuclease V [Galdieria sulphuraria]|eukprot:XP_005703478.1 exodeoxyribonuclease V [Galdieria sulphuraria]
MMRLTSQLCSKSCFLSNLTTTVVTTSFRWLRNTGICDNPSLGTKVLLSTTSLRCDDFTRKSRYSPSPYMKTNRDEQAQKTLHKFQGVVERIFYRQRETGFSVAEVRIIASSTDIPESVIQVVGTLGNVQEGDEFRGSGFITIHPKYGKQLRLVGNNQSDTKEQTTTRQSSPERHHIIVEKVVFTAPDDSGFAVGQARLLDNNEDDLSFEQQSETERVTVVGKLGRIEEGLHLAVEGIWVNHSKYGKQFQVQVAQTEPFSDVQY